MLHDYDVLLPGGYYCDLMTEHCVPTPDGC